MAPTEELNPLLLLLRRVRLARESKPVSVSPRHHHRRHRRRLEDLFAQQEILSNEAFKSILSLWKCRTNRGEYVVGGFITIIIIVGRETSDLFGYLRCCIGRLL